MEIKKTIELLNGTFFDNKLTELYVDLNRIPYEKERYRKAIDSYKTFFGEGEIEIFSAPGRSEIGGNHTDHQLGRVLCASVNMDIIAVVIRQDDKCEYYADGFDCPAVYCSDLDVCEDEKFTTASLIRGTLAGFKQNGYNIGGFSE